MTKPSNSSLPPKISKRITYAARVRAAYEYGLVFDRFHVECPPRKKSS